MRKNYTLSVRAPYSSGWSKSAHKSLAIALNTAWRKYKRDYSIGEITFERKVIINNEELIQAMTLMDNLAREQSKPGPYKLAEQVIREMGQATADG